MSDVTVDLSDLLRLADDISSIVPAVEAEAPKIVKRGAQNVKTDAIRLIRAQTPGKTHLPHYPRAISYDLRGGRREPTAEIGPDSSRPQGAMGAAIEEGGARAGAMPHMNPALDDESPKFTAAAGDLVLDAIREAL